ncbi:hypothetical protein [Marinimicrobium locisalis]|uniref:hypothetical protein n=1 Tax=Marinimicrobium locisalis TaxID=546022 RepID=UPI0032218F1B
MNNQNSLLFLLSVLLLSSCSMAEMPEADDAFLPLSIDQVETYRVEDLLLRLIKHNMEIEPRFELELIKPGGRKGVDRREVTSITLDGKTLSFTESAGVYVESMGANNEGATLVLEYFHLQGSAVMIECTFPVVNQKIEPPQCQSE